VGLHGFAVFLVALGGQQLADGFAGQHGHQLAVFVWVGHQHGLDALGLHLLADQGAQGFFGGAVGGIVQPQVALYPGVPGAGHEGFGFAPGDHGLAVGLGLLELASAVGGVFGFEAGRVGANVCALHVGEEVGVGTGALGAGAAAAGGGDQGGVGDLEAGFPQAQHVLPLNERRGFAVAEGLAAVGVVEVGQGLGLQPGVWYAGNEQRQGGRKATVSQGFAAFWAEVEQLQAAIHVAAAFADLGAHFLGGERGLVGVHEVVVTLGLFERLQVIALQVFHQLDFEHLRVGEGADHGGDGVKPGDDAGAQAALAAHQLPLRAGLQVGGVGHAIAGQRAHQHRLVHATGLDAVGQLGELV